MKITIDHLGLFLLAVFLGWGCTSGPAGKQAHISARFSVADSVQPSQDYSGIGLTIIGRDSADAKADTLFSETTDSTGIISGPVTFKEKRQYPAIISRHNTKLGRVGLILSEGDSIRIEGTLPKLEESLSISSDEHEVMKTYKRINRNFQRIRRYARAGRLTGDSLRQEIMKWSDLYWQVYTDNKRTLASELAARNAIRMLQGVDDDKMMTRLRSIQDQDRFSDLGAAMGKKYMARSRGLTSALRYLDTLNAITDDTEKGMNVAMERIKLLYDSARVEAAKKALQEFKQQYSKKERPGEWVESINYDLNYLSPGDAVPYFELADNGRRLSRDSLLGTPYILEVTRLSNNLYQRQFDRTVAIHSIYKNFGIQVVTLPLDKSQVTVDAFFSERLKPWPVADVETFDRKALIEKFNIRLIPTRFLIDREGKIIRKYVGKEYQDVIQGIQSLIKKEKQPAP